MNDDDTLDRSDPSEHPLMPAAPSATDEEASAMPGNRGVPNATEDDFRMLADSIPQLAWIADRDGSVVGQFEIRAGS